MIGRVIQNYRIEQLLGEGGMGTVYRAADTLLQRPVALKVLHAHLMRDTSFFERFRNEAIVSARLNHPNVAMLYNFIKDGDDNFMVMEYVDGATLEQLLHKQGRFSTENALRVVMQALQGLQHAHRKEILHRDIKPANLMLTKEGNVKLMDFGIARLVGSERLTRLNRVMGTLEYLAPELLDGGEPSVRSDLYAMGVVLYELLSGQMPFNATTDSTLIHQILTQKPVPIRERVADLPKELEKVLDRLLQKKPEKRFQSANELRAALAVLVPPAPLDWQQFQGPARTVVVRPPASAVTADKPLAAPSRLLGTFGDTAGGSAWGAALLERAGNLKIDPDWAKIKRQVLTQEGLILLGALLLALGILTAGFWTTESTPETVASLPDTTAAAVTLRPMEQEDAPGNDGSPPPNSRQSQTIGYETGTADNYPVTRLPPEREAPERKTTPKKSPPEAKKGAPERREPSPAEPKEEETSPEKEEPAIRKEVPPAAEVKEDRAPVVISPRRTISVELRNEQFPVAFNETLTSDQENRAGTTVWLRTLAPVVVDGATAIEAGARVRGRVTEVRSSTTSKRAYLAVKFEAVQAVNGQWVSIRFPEYSNRDSRRVVFERNRRVNNVRVYRTSLMLRQ